MSTSESVPVVVVKYDDWHQTVMAHLELEMGSASPEAQGLHGGEIGNSKRFTDWKGEGEVEVG